MDCLHLHLNLPGMSRRVVRCRVLEPDVYRAEERNGIKSARIAAGDDGGATLDEIRAECVRYWLSRFIVGLTDPGVTPATDPVSKEIDWGRADPQAVAKATFHKPSPAELVNEGGAYLLEKVFSVRELAAIRLLFQEHNEMSVAEMNMLRGKALPVATEG